MLLATLSKLKANQHLSEKNPRRSVDKTKLDLDILIIHLVKSEIFFSDGCFIFI